MRPRLGTAIMVLGLIVLQHQIAWMPGLARLVLLSVAGAVIYIAWTWFLNRAALTELLGTIRSR